MRSVLSIRYSTLDLSCAKDVPCGASPQSSQRSRLLRVIGGGTSSLPIRLRRNGGAAPLQTTPLVVLDIGIGYRIPMGEVVVPRPWESLPQPFRTRRLEQGKGRWSRASIDPCSSLVYSVARRVNSAIRERGLRRSATRNYSAPVVTHCCIDPTTSPPDAHRTRPSCSTPS